MGQAAHVKRSRSCSSSTMTCVTASRRGCAMSMRRNRPVVQNSSDVVLLTCESAVR